MLSFSEILAGIESYYVNQMRDVLRARDVALEISQEHLHLAKQVIEASRDGIIVTDPDGVIQSINPAFTTITGYNANDAIGKTPAILQSGRHDKAFYRTLWTSLHTDGHWAGEVWNRRKNGEIYPEWLSITTIKNEQGEVIKRAAILSDISDRKKSEEQIRNLAYFDVLTQLPNRRLFHDRLDIAIANAHRHRHRLGVIFLDLDLFKRVNDTLGHSVGDTLLVQVAQRLTTELREGDTASRMGGDEFTILLQEINSSEDAVAIARRIIQSLSQPFLVNDNTLYVTASIGISIYPDDGPNRETLLRNADTAMYRAKDNGRNSYQLYTAEMNANAIANLAMESGLRNALKNNEFILHYQAKVNTQTGRITGAEALIRWAHPDLGTVPPSTFISLAEDIGLITELGEWVLRQAARQCRQWVEQGHREFRMSVNVSACQLTKADFPDRVLTILRETGLDPRHLELELTESAVMERMEEVAPMLGLLRSHNIHISIDDFGTGYSNFGYLKRLPIDKLKIDISFIKEVPRNQDDSELVAAMIAMAHKLKLAVVAEGVEHERQLEFLRQHACDEIQGFLFSRPIPANEFEALLLSKTSLTGS